ncbi:hypothetical protein SH661x_004114 [Planctomicrobium sp. SH661]|uniref:hypothetical protein n=1 Tax=Planctomicrobium sp. SH661 TaxID=3448124 RepID=UPI003F5C3F08
MPSLSAIVLVMVVAGCGGQPQKPATAPPVQLPAAAQPQTSPTHETVDVVEVEEETFEPEEVPQEPVVQKIYRDSDRRPQRDDARAAEFGIRKYSSERLILYTDIDPALAEPLPELVDQAYAAWVKYFGELPPNREGTPYQITGYLIEDPQRFVAAGMLPEGPPMFRFGRHLGAEFWMNKMNSDYYRRHLLIHEATHCFMTTMLRQYPPRWYLEGMAEYFGTHVVHPDGTVEFGVMPGRSEAFPGLGRIESIQQELVRGKPASLAHLGAYTGHDWDQPLPIPYAWSWALCQFLDEHPRYRDRFRELGQHMEESAFLRYMADHFEQDRALLAAEWDQYQKRLVYGYDVAANAFATSPEPLRPLESPVSVNVDSSKGWQSTGLHLTANQPVQIDVEGEVILDETSQPWRSEPQGISIRYAAGEPIGLLMAGILPDQTSQSSHEVFEVIPVGRGTEFVPRFSGELWLRVNDVGNGLGNNSGEYHVQIRTK